MREDALQLFGFATPQEKYVFERLISVSGIGPKVALTVLSGLPLPELVGAIASQNARRPVDDPRRRQEARRAPRPRAEGEARGLRRRAARRAARRAKTSVVDDAIGALQNLGYKALQAEQAVESAVRGVGAADLNKILSAALKSLAR